MTTLLSPNYRCRCHISPKDREYLVSFEGSDWLAPRDTIVSDPSTIINELLQNNWTYES